MIVVIIVLVQIYVCIIFLKRERKREKKIDWMKKYQFIKKMNCFKKGFVKCDRLNVINIDVWKE